MLCSKGPLFRGIFLKLMFKLGRWLGFFLGSLIFASMLFFIMSRASRIDMNLVNYMVFYSIALFVSFIYAAFKIVRARLEGGVWNEIKAGFHDFGKYITNIVNFFLLLIVYFIGVGLSSVINKLNKKKSLDLTSRSSKSYWKDYNLKKEKKSNYYRQF
jgi:large-conductance mechanosensitive channel